MTDFFISNLNRYFRVNNYRLLKKVDDKVYTYLVKAQNHAYIVNIYNCDVTTLDNIESDIDNCEKAVEHNFKDIVGINRNIILNIFIGKDNIKPLYEKFKNKEVEYDKKIMTISWFADLIDKQLKIPKGHPDKIMDIEKEIWNMLNPEQFSYNKKTKLSLNPLSNNCYMTFGFIIINVVIWVCMQLSGGSTNYQVLLDFGANHPELIFDYHQYWRLFTSMFIHIGFAHLAYNILALYIFGTRIERYMNKVSFVMIYLLSGLFAGLASSIIAVLMGNLNIAAGASGAIFGLEGCALVLATKSGKELDGLSSMVIWIMVIVGIAMGFVYTNVDNTAHIVGFIAGYLLTLLNLKINHKH